MSNNTGKIIMFGWKRGGPNTIWEKRQSSIAKRILQRLDLHMYVDVILFVICKENHTICNVYINLTQPMFGSCQKYHTSGLCNIIVHAEIEYKRSNDLFYFLNFYKKRVMYHFVYIIKTLTSRSGYITSI
jgi:hypothetical protein